MQRLYCILFIWLALWVQELSSAQASSDPIVVAKDGSGDFKRIQAAINHLRDSSGVPRTIFIKNGIYEEKIYLEKNNNILERESQEKTIITQSVARDQWRCLHNDDWGVATVNVDGNYITFKNLSTINNYGLDNKINITIYCLLDTINGQQKTIRPNGHQMALRTMNATRVKAIHCRFSAYAGDTVSPWNVESGLFYFKDCVLEGGVDFYCPRGWACTKDGRFIAYWAMRRSGMTDQNLKILKLYS